MAIYITEIINSLKIIKTLTWHIYEVYFLLRNCLKTKVQCKFSPMKKNCGRNHWGNWQGVAYWHRCSWDRALSSHDKNLWAGSGRKLFWGQDRILWDWADIARSLELGATMTAPPAAPGWTRSGFWMAMDQLRCGWDWSFVCWFWLGQLQQHLRRQEQEYLGAYGRDHMGRTDLIWGFPCNLWS